MKRLRLLFRAWFASPDPLPDSRAAALKRLIEAGPPLVPPAGYPAAKEVNHA